VALSKATPVADLPPAAVGIMPIPPDVAKNTLDDAPIACSNEDKYRGFEPY
jgi:hypothetical protein